MLFRSRTPLRNVAVLGETTVEIAPYNDQLARYEAIFAAEMPAMARVSADAQQIAFKDHRWGLSPFHYVPAYYDEIRRQLGDLGLEEAFSARADAPSVPAA